MLFTYSKLYYTKFLSSTVAYVKVVADKPIQEPELKMLHITFPIKFMSKAVRPLERKRNEDILETLNIQSSDLNKITKLIEHRADPMAALSEARALSARTLDRGFESRSRHGCLSSSLYIVLSCVGRGLATS
jgi:hypothetical protein